MIRKVSILRREDNRRSGKKENTSHNVADMTKAHYVGLLNQGNTCYLNTCIQTLYMTPEFRNLIYSWRYEDENTFFNANFEGALLLQMQKLFVNLQTSQKSAIQTTSLTSSFGWSVKHVQQQHDVQEFYQALLNVIEKPLGNSINQIYEGNMMDFIKCSECNTETVKKLSFRNIPLPVRCPYSNLESYSTVELALQAYLTAEILDGENKYRCDVCGTETRAKKGLKMTKLPYILTFQINRFARDYNIQEIVKLNDKVSFPYVLNLNWCLESESDTDSSELKTPITLEGPYVYELFSIIIHSGTPAKGHYFAYIKDFRTEKWQCFNDHLVTPISHKEIQEAYGNGSNANAYVITYRQIDRIRNTLPIEVSQFPQHIKEFCEVTKKSKASVTIESENESARLSRKWQSEDKVEDISLQWDMHDTEMNETEDESIIDQYVYLLPAPTITKLYTLDDCSTDEVKSYEKVMKWLSNSDFNHETTYSCTLSHEISSEKNFYVNSFPVPFKHYSEKIIKKYEMIKKEKLPIQQHTHCDDMNKAVEDLHFANEVEEDTMNIVMYVEPLTTEEIPLCSHVQESSIMGDNCSTQSSVSTVLIFIDPEISIVQEQVNGNKAKVLIKWDDGRETVIDFSIPENEHCTVQDLLDEIKIPSSYKISVMLHSDPTIANYVVNATCSLYNGDERAVPVLDNTDPNKTVIIYPPPPAAGGFQIKQIHLNCLEEGEYLNDIIVDFYLAYVLCELVSSSDRVKSYLFSSFFFKRISSFLNEKNTKLTKNKYKLVQRWTKKVNLFEKDFIIFPINQSKHWFLIIICFANNLCINNMLVARKSESTKCKEIKKPCILILDSLGGIRSEVADILRQYLNFEYGKNTNTANIFTPENLPTLHLKVPQQINLTDCGIYLLQYAESFFMNPIKDYKTLQHQSMDEWFDHACILNKRKSIKNLIQHLASRNKNNANYL